MLTVDPVVTKSDLREFVELPRELYRHDRNWVPPLLRERYETLNTRRNPFFEHAKMQLFLARVDGAVVGRIGAIHNYLHNQVHHDRVGFFGFFESIDAPEVAERLFAAASDWLIREGCDRIRGPVSPSLHDECGLLVEGFDEPPRFLMPYNPGYYLKLFDGAGFTVAKQLWAYRVRGSDLLRSEKLMRVAQQARQRQGLSLRMVDMKSLNSELSTIRSLYNEAWSGNWGFVPLTSAEASFMAKRLKMLAEPSLIIFAEVRGKAVGIALVLPDYNEVLKEMDGRLFPLGWLKLLTGRRRIRRLRLLLIGVLEGWRTRGIDAALYYQLAQNAARLGIDECEGSWVLEDNTRMNRIMPALGGSIYKRFNLYERAL